MSEKQRKNRRAHLNDFHKNEKGDYEFQGAYLEWKIEPADYRRERIVFALMSAGILISFAAAGCVAAPGTVDCAYVVFPYTISLVAGISTVWGIWKMIFAGNPMRAYQYEASVEKIPVRAIVTMIFAGAAIVGELIYLLKNGGEGSLAGILLFFGLETIGFVISLLVFRKIQKMTWEKTAGKIKSKIDKSF